MDRRPSPARLLRRTSFDTWQDIVPELESRLDMTADRRVLRLWVLVLDSRSVPNRPDYGASRRGSWLGRPAGAVPGSQVGLYVPASQEERALDEIEQYVRENAGITGRVSIPQPPARAGIGQTLFVLCALALFHAFVSRTSSAGPVDWTELGHGAQGLVLAWREAGVSDCFRIRVAGEWWRTVTALTLHADAGHLLSNCLFGGLFFYLVTRRVGAALGWGAILFSGIVGNMVNCRVEGYEHVSLGASTAVLGAVGVLAGIGAAQAGLGMLSSSGSQGNVWGRAWRGVLLPLAMGVALLAFLGAGEGNIDLGAHLFGFLCGILPGVAAGWLSQTGRVPSRPWDGLLASFALLFVVVCWIIAFR
ncbi:rhomboid family intramembrane serine protease [Oceanidesulfovibrio indonesiensis]|nr:rhomboid family intramembrane serine protease [Oceanidesulfovibrio indonesiensis]